MSFSGFFFCILAYATHKALPLSLIPVQAIWSITYLVIIGSVFTFAAFIYALKNLPVSLTSIYAYINPIIAVILGAMVLNEKMTWYIVFGGALTLSGVYLVNRSFKPREN